MVPLKDLEAFIFKLRKYFRGIAGIWRPAGKHYLLIDWTLNNKTDSQIDLIFPLR